MFRRVCVTASVSSEPLSALSPSPRGAFNEPGDVRRFQLRGLDQVSDAVSCSCGSGEEPNEGGQVLSVHTES